MTMDFSVKHQKRMVFLLRLFLGGVFLWASIPKILHPLPFAVVVKDYQLLPDMLVNVFAIILPWLELLLGAFLIIGFWLPGTVGLASMLLLVFFLALAFNVARGIDVHCGCFSTEPLGNPKTTWYFVRDAIFVAVAVFLLFNVLKEEK